MMKVTRVIKVTKMIKVTRMIKIQYLEIIQIDSPVTTIKQVEKSETKR